MAISPPLIGSRPATMLRIVLLPQPEGPMRATNSPSTMSNDTDSTAWRARPPSPYVLRRLRTPMRTGAAAVISSELLLRGEDEARIDDVRERDRLDVGAFAEPDLRP